MLIPTALPAFADARSAAKGFPPRVGEADLHRHDGALKMFGGG
jgi:hypothetical protein